MSNPAPKRHVFSPTAILAVMFASMLLVLAVTPAADAADDILANPKCCSFAPGPFTQDLGEIPNMVIPADANAPHNAISTELGPDGQPLFGAPTNLAGTTTPLDGAQYLEAGTYPFVCSLHAPSMSGELVVGTKGTVVPRPKVKAVFPAQRLKAVRKKGVRLRLKGVTAVPGATVQVRLVGKGLFGEKLDVALAAGQTRVIRFKLPKKLKKAIRKRRAVKFKAAVSLRYGSPTSAVRKVK